MNPFKEHCFPILHGDILLRVLNSMASKLGKTCDVIQIGRSHSTSAFYFLETSDIDLGYRFGKVLNSEENSESVISFLENCETFLINTKYVLLRSSNEGDCDDGFIIFNPEHIVDIKSLPKSDYVRAHIHVPTKEDDSDFIINMNHETTKKLISIIESLGKYDLLLKLEDFYDSY
jgi:hypothetical protein